MDPSKYCLRSKYLWQWPKFEMPDGRGAYDNNGVMMHPESAFPSVVWIGKQTWHHILIGPNTFLGLFVGLVKHPGMPSLVVLEAPSMPIDDSAA